MFKGRTILIVIAACLLISELAVGTLQMYMGQEVEVDYDLQLPGESGRYATMIIIDAFPTLESYSANMNIIVRYDNALGAYGLFGFAWGEIAELEADIVSSVGGHSLGPDGLYWEGMAINPDEDAQWHLFDSPRVGPPEWSFVPTGVFENMTVVSGGWLGAVLNSGVTPVIHTPEPATVLLLGLGGLVLVRKRRRNPHETKQVLRLLERLRR